MKFRNPGKGLAPPDEASNEQPWRILTACLMSSNIINLFSLLSWQITTTTVPSVIYLATKPDTKPRVDSNRKFSDCWCLSQPWRVPRGACFAMQRRRIYIAVFFSQLGYALSSWYLYLSLHTRRRTTLQNPANSWNAMVRNPENHDWGALAATSEFGIWHWAWYPPSKIRLDCLALWTSIENCHPTYKHIIACRSQRRVKSSRLFLVLFIERNPKIKLEKPRAIHFKSPPPPPW